MDSAADVPGSPQDGQPDNPTPGQQGVRVLIPWALLQENLVTISEVARRFGLSRAAPVLWRKGHRDFPGPVLTYNDTHSGHTAHGDLFWWPDVQQFCQAHGLPPRRGRPPKQLPPDN